MFTGIVAAVGKLVRVTPTADGARIHVAAPELDLADGQLWRLELGHDVCCAGHFVTH